ncbi:hypothetical protein [Cohnella candidum]|uniref:Pilus assembly protein n=1 Tax=Cohnella candidum TaxID=2674991 RepID=A0A3G3JZK1_9BACL|nr:hypothetical protein [Cohnella candidum]AYQ73680.1 hypothetical protein EAV92_14475 [Cohnella candidum]
MVAGIRALRRFGSGEQGSMTLEGALVFPWVLLTTLLLILFSVGMLEKALLYYSASAESGRAAFAWSHSSASGKTGGYPSGGYDGLYWRLGDDALLAGELGMSADGNGSRVDIGNGGGEDGSPAEKKLRKSAEAFPSFVGGELKYRNQGWLRTVSVDASGGLIPTPVLRFRNSAETRHSASVSSTVTEPAEWIRTFQSVRYFREKMRKKGQSAETYRQKAASVLAGKR